MSTPRPSETLDHGHQSDLAGTLLDAVDADAQKPAIPIIRQINAMAHPNAIRMGLGELSYPVHPRVKEILAENRPEFFKYAPNAGIPELREAIAGKYGTEYTPENVLVTVGVQEAMFSTLFSLKKHISKVLIPEVNFGIYRSIPTALGIEVETFKVKDDFSVDLNDLTAKLKTFQPQAVIINSPGNPTGRVYDSKERSLLALALNNAGRPLLISDEIYSELTFDEGRFWTMNDHYDLSIITDGISKSGAAAGLRVGWAFSRNKAIMSAITRGSTMVKSSGPSNNQYAAIPIVTGETKDSIEMYRRTLQHNSHLAQTYLKRMEHVSFTPTQGGFYCFPDVSYYTGPDTMDFCKAAAQSGHGVVVIPGSAFGRPSNIRISLAGGGIEDGMRRLHLLLAEYKTKKEATLIAG